MMKILRAAVKTRRDLSVWIIASFWLLLNLAAILIWGSFGTVISNIIALALISGFIFWSKGNEKVNSWLDKEL